MKSSLSYAIGLSILSFIGVYFAVWEFAILATIFRDANPTLGFIPAGEIIRAATTFDIVVAQFLMVTFMSGTALYALRLRIAVYALAASAAAHMYLWLNFLALPTAGIFDGAPGFLVISGEAVLFFILSKLWRANDLRGLRSGPPT